MSFADDKFLPSGTYSIINVGYNCPISFSEQSTSVGWTISFLANKKWTIQGPLNVFFDISPDAEEGDDLASVKNPPKPHQWAIKRHSGEAHAYIIYSPSQPQLFWSLPNGNEGTTPQLSTDRDGVASLWKFKKIELTANSPDPIEQLVAAPVQRPTQLDPSKKNMLAITIPPGWLTTISSVSCGNCINLIRVRRVVNGALEKQDLISGWDAVDKAMTIDGSDSDSLALPSTEDAYVLVVEAFHSKNRVRKDPRKLPGFKDLSTNLRVITTSRASYMKGFPDFQTFTIFDESLDVSGAGRAQNAIITIHASLKVAVDLNDPGKPEPDTVRAKVASSSGSQFRSIYYRVYNKESAIPTKRPAYLNNTYIGRIKSEWVAPPHNAGSLRLCLSSMENVDPNKTRLFTTSSGKAPLADDIPVSLKNNQTLGLMPGEPLALTFSGAIPEDGMKPGTESLRIRPEAQSPVTPRFLYYGIYNEGGVSASKRPVDPEEPWVSKVDLDLIPPPLSVTSLMSFISATEGIASGCSSQLFVDKDTMSPLNDDHILTEKGNWPGSTTEGHVMFKLITDTNQCKGFPSGRFRIRGSVGLKYYWTFRWWKTDKEGNALCLWGSSGLDHAAQVFFVNSMGNLCCSNGKALDVMDNSIVLTHDRERTEPWPNPWSHPLPTFSYSEETKIITVKTHVDPFVTNHWPRPESEWKDKEFAVAASSVVATKIRKFQEIAKWAPDSVRNDEVRRNQWTSLGPWLFAANDVYNLGVEEKGKNMQPKDLDRMKWELEIARS